MASSSSRDFSAAVSANRSHSGSFDWFGDADDSATEGHAMHQSATTVPRPPAGLPDYDSQSDVVMGQNTVSTVDDPMTIQGSEVSTSAVANA